MRDPSPPQSHAAAHQFAVQRIYLKDASFESPASPQVFTHPSHPQVQMEVDIRTTTLPEDRYEVVITLTLTARQEQKTFFLVEIEQAESVRTQNSCNHNQ